MTQWVEHAARTQIQKKYVEILVAKPKVTFCRVACTVYMILLLQLSLCFVTHHVIKHIVEWRYNSTH
jgi:hypothetical protein